MSFYYFKNIPLLLNGNQIVPSDIQLQTEIGIIHPYRIEERNNARNIISMPRKSTMQIKYFLTGQDYLKPYLYSLENEKITGNLAGFIFTQSYISDYAVTFSPNSPIEVSATLEIYDKVSGNFTPSNPIIQTGTILRTSDIIINNLSNYTSTTINNIVQASYSYNCKLNPSYFYDSGVETTQADRVSIEDRKWDLEVISDSVDFNIPLSGQQFAITISGQNPFNNQINESFSASGVIYQKQFSISNNKVHSHILRLSQNHANNFGAISGVVINSNNFIINSTQGYHPFTNQSLSCVDKIIVGDTICTGFSASNQGNFDQITVPIPNNIINGPLTVYSSKGNLLWPSPLQFNYSNITITGISQLTGYPGTPIYISGTNFYRISQVNYGGVPSTFQINSSNLILSVVPPNGLTNYIQLISDLRSLTGYNNSFFYCQPSINSTSPTTGKWGDTLILGGQNFSGTTGVFFGTGMVGASSFNLIDNFTLSVQTPPTGSGFSAGYITVLTSGGSTQSISQYKPQVSIFSFSGTSGIFFNSVNLSLIVDSGYLCSTGGGYKLRFGGIDTIFFQNGTGLSGQVPFGATTDYIYLYQPDGVSTYTPNSLQFSVNSAPSIFSITPATINQYKYFSPVLVGENFEFFTPNLSYFYAFSGGINGDMQTGNMIISNSGGNADTLYIPNAIITGATGYYNVLIQNFAGTGIFVSGLMVTTGINQSLSCRASISPSNRQVGTYIASMALDKNTGSFAALECTAVTSGVSLNVTPRNNNVMNVSLVQIIVSTINITDTQQGAIVPGPTYTANTSGAISFWYKNASSPFYSGPIVNFAIQSNRIINLFNSGITGVSIVKVHTPGIGSATNEYLGVNELSIY